MPTGANRYSYYFSDCQTAFVRLHEGESDSDLRLNSGEFMDFHARRIMKGRAEGKDLAGAFLRRGMAAESNSAAEGFGDVLIDRSE